MKESIDFKELARTERRNLARKKDQLVAEINDIDDRIHLMDGIDELLAEKEQQKAEIADLQEQLCEERHQRMELEVKMVEMSKLSAGMAKKAAQDDLEKALRIYLNISKRKIASKREAAKTVITEMLNSAKLELPDDIRDLLDHLDDEQSEPKVVMNGGVYNDIHDNRDVRGKM